MLGLIVAEDAFYFEYFLWISIISSTPLFTPFFYPRTSPLSPFIPSSLLFLFSIINQIVFKSIMFYPKLRSSFSSINKKTILSATYESLAETIRKQYNFQQFKIPSTLSLLQAHHQFQIFKPGDWVLDIGAGPHWSWTDLAIKLTNNQNNTNLVISNDISEMVAQRQQNRFVRGKFEQQQIKTKIAMNLLDRQLNTILIDGTDEYKGEVNVDAMYTLNLVYESLKFSHRYLKKGGSIVFRSLQTQRTLHFQQKAKFLFNQVYRYKPSNLRHGSPVAFFVLKGFQMTPNEEGLKNFLSEYKGKKQKKIAVVQQYRKMYNWDPVEIIENQAKERILKMKENGLKNKQIIKVFENQPFVKINDLLKDFNLLEDPNASIIQKIKVRQKLITGKEPFYKQDLLPTTQEQFAEFFLKPQPEKPKNAPLGQNQIYMKEQVDEDDKMTDKYTKEDLYGYSVGEEVEVSEEEMQIEMNKIHQTFEELREKQKAEGNEKNEIYNFFNEKDRYEAYLKEKEKWDALSSEEKQRQDEQMRREIDRAEEEYESKMQHMRSQQPKAERAVNRKVSKKRKTPF